jgi:hypothetical protein
MRRSRQYTQKTAIHGHIADAISISERPATADATRRVIEDRSGPDAKHGATVEPPAFAGGAIEMPIVGQLEACHRQSAVAVLA